MKILNYLFTSALLIVSVQPLFSVNQETDSIRGLLNTNTKQDSNYVQLLLAYYKLSVENETDSALIVSQKAYEISKDIGYKTGELNALNALGVSHWYKNIPDKTIDYFKQSLQKAIEYKNLEHQSKVSNNLGLYYNMLGISDSALKFHLISVDAAAVNKESYRYTKALSDLSMIHYYQGNYPEAIKCILESNIYYEKNQMLDELALNLTRLGMIYSDLSNYEKSMQSFRKALHLNQIAKNQPLKISLFQNIGRILYDLKHDNDSASYYLNEALKLTNDKNDADKKIGILINLANIKADEKKYQEALKLYQEVSELPVIHLYNRENSALLINTGYAYFMLGDLTKAERYVEEGLSIASKNKILVFKKNGLKTMGDIQAKKGDYKKAFENYAHFAALQDTLSNTELKNKLAEAVFENSLQQKESANLILQKDNVIKQHLITRQYYIIIFTVLLILAGFILIMVVISNSKKQKALNQELAAKNEELNEINKAKDKFFSIISHDLRMPFNGFLGLSRLLVEEMPIMKREEITHIAKNMLISATNSFQLLEELLDWARLQKEDLKLNLQTYQVQSLIRESIGSLVEAATKKAIEITLLIPEDMPVTCDAGMLKTVVRNIVSNAIKFTAPHGQIRIVVKDEPGHGLHFSISDTGIGMNPHKISTLFQLNNTSSQKGTEGELGTGLGLIICNEIMLKHQGKIWAESIQGVGSTFHFNLPHLKPYV